ncbi:hypothetical protein RUND412_006547 [Rhizina undulata]
MDVSSWEDQRAFFQTAYSPDVILIANAGVSGEEPLLNDEFDREEDTVPFNPMSASLVAVINQLILSDVSHEFYSMLYSVGPSMVSFLALFRSSEGGGDQLFEGGITNATKLDAEDGWGCE